MELFGIMLSVPGAFVATTFYVPFVRLLFVLGWIRWIAAFLSVTILAALVFEWVTLARIGPLGAREWIGPAFDPLHTIVFLLAIPAFANVLVLSFGRKGCVSWLLLAGLAACFALPVVLTQYVVAEALYGIDGTGGPYSDPPVF